MWIKRKIADTILNVNSQYPVVLVTGARQVVKKTLFWSRITAIWENG